MTILGTKTWAVEEDVASTDFNTYIGPPPNTIDVNPHMTPTATTGFTTLTQSTNDIGNGVRMNTPALNDSIEWDVVLAAGTWTLELMSRKDASSAILTVALSSDGSSYTDVGTIDLYNGSTVYNQLSSLTGISVAATGRYRLRLKAATKNASSSNYAAYLNGLRLRRTA